MELKEIGYIKTDFPEKFGIPRQSGILDKLESKIYFYPEYRNPDAYNGIEGFSHLWILWKFDIPEKKGWSATVKPPRLGGNKQVGVFASRSPFRPNPIGLSSVRLIKYEYTEDGPVLTISGADLRDGTKILDIKPYLGYTDSHPDAIDGFASEYMYNELDVIFPENLLGIIPPEKQSSAIKMLKEDPRPHYQDDPERIYGVAFAGFDIRFKVREKTLTVIEIVPYRGRKF